MGKLYRGAVIIGTDLSPIQRRKEVSIDARSILSYDNVPVNVEWIMDDLELEWVDPIPPYTTTFTVEILAAP
ncbi:hypothetical protein VCV18_012541 [Metarhizium anisopliae]